MRTTFKNSDHQKLSQLVSFTLCHDQTLITPSLPADTTVSPLWSNVTLCTASLCPDMLLTTQESTSTSLTRLSLLATASVFPDGLNATWLVANGPASTVAIANAGFLMSHRLIMPHESQEAMKLPAWLMAVWLQGCWCP